MFDDEGGMRDRMKSLRWGSAQWLTALPGFICCATDGERVRVLSSISGNPNADSMTRFRSSNYVVIQSACMSRITWLLKRHPFLACDKS
jgi:hypothetical protein